MHNYIITFYNAGNLYRSVIQAENLLEACAKGFSLRGNNLVNVEFAVNAEGLK